MICFLHRMALAILVAALLGPGALAVAGVADGAERPRAGLMWNRTGLPAVFPLVVKTLPGRDFRLVLHEADSGDAALAAYIRGGAFFRVLVPPGTYEVRLDHGTGWRGENGLFGPDTERFVLPEDLTFEVVGLSRKRGHVLDLRGVFGEGAVTAAHAPIAICQRVVDRPARYTGDRGPAFGGPPRHRPGSPAAGLAQDVLSRVCDPRPG